MTKQKPASVLVADPPWQFGDKLPGPKRGASSHYSTLSITELCRFPLPPIADDAILFLWRVSAMQGEALRLVEAWGFELKSELVWIKTTASGEPAFGMGRYVRASHETCLIARRGKAKVRDRSVRSVFFAPRGIHSEKPGEFYQIVERLVDGPRAELFARRRRHGWTCYGDQLPKLKEA